MTRKQANLEIMNELSEYLNSNADMRFGQALRNLGIVVDFQEPPTEPGGWNPVQWMNHFNEEPTEMLRRIYKRKQEMKK